MTFNDLLSACDRLRSDPRVEGRLEVIVKGTGAIWKIELADSPRRIIIYCTP